MVNLWLLGNCHAGVNAVFHGFQEVDRFLNSGLVIVVPFVDVQANRVPALTPLWLWLCSDAFELLPLATAISLLLIADSAVSEGRSVFSFRSIGLKTAEIILKISHGRAKVDLCLGMCVPLDF